MCSVTCFFYGRRGISYIFNIHVPVFLHVSLLSPRSFACEVICRHALSAVLHPPPGGGRAAITVTTSLLLWVLEGDQESCAEVLAERWGALRLRVSALAGEVCMYIYIYDTLERCSRHLGIVLLFHV